MKNQQLSLFIFIDAFGWEVLQKHPTFLEGLIVDKKKLKTIFGYSSACDPSIISGLLPFQHGLWSSFYYSPKTCPYKWVRHLQLLPKTITKRNSVRNLLSRIIKKIHGFTGYFQIYQLPFEVLPLFDYAEKYRIWQPKGPLQGLSIFDILAKKNISYHVREEGLKDHERIEEMAEIIQKGSIQMGFLLLGELDALMHKYGTVNAKIDELVSSYDKQIRALIQTAQNNYQNVSWYIYSDHGMHIVEKTFDLQSVITGLGLEYGKDFVALYDSTMARFWFLNDIARENIRKCLSKINEGKILSDTELKEFGVFFPDHKYGELIFLMNPGILIIPSFMGLKKIPGMHGYHPNEPDSYAMICSNQKLPENITEIHQIFGLMNRF